MATGSDTVTNDKIKSKDTEEKVNWLAELRGLSLMLLAVLVFHSLVAKPF